MRVLVQRVRRAAVRIEGRTVAEIGRGLVALVGVRQGDTGAEADWMARFHEFAGQKTTILITHRFSLDKAAEAYTLCETRAGDDPLKGLYEDSEVIEGEALEITE